MMQKATIKTSMLRLVIDCGIIKVIPLLLVTQMKNIAMDSQQQGIQEDATCRADSICSCNASNEGDDEDTANNVSSSMIILKHMVLASLVAL